MSFHYNELVLCIIICFSICYLTVLLSAYVSYLFCGTSGNVEFLWYFLFHSWKRLKFGVLLAIVLLMGDVAVFFGAWGE